MYPEFVIVALRVGGIHDLENLNAQDRALDGLESKHEYGALNTCDRLLQAARRAVDQAQKLGAQSRVTLDEGGKLVHRRRIVGRKLKRLRGNGGECG